MSSNRFIFCLELHCPKPWRDGPMPADVFKVKRKLRIPHGVLELPESEEDWIRFIAKDTRRQLNTPGYIEGLLRYLLAEKRRPKWEQGSGDRWRVEVAGTNYALTCWPWPAEGCWCWEVWDSSVNQDEPVCQGRASGYPVACQMAEKALREYAEVAK